MRKTLLLSIFAVISLQYIYILDYNITTEWWMYETKPFAGRVLIPLLANILPFNQNTSILVLVFLSCVGVGAVMLAFRDRFHRFNAPGDVYLISVFAAFIFLVSAFSKYYDIPTAFFFTLLVYLWACGKTEWTLLLFLLLSVNRETAFILIPVFVFCFWGKMSIKTLLYWTISMTLAFALSRLSIMVYTQGVSGSSVWVRPAENMEAYKSSVLGIALFLALFSAFALSVIRTPSNSVRWFLIITFPTLFAAHIAFGMPYEVRMFAEVFPLMLINLHGVKNETKRQTREVPSMLQDRKDFVSNGRPG